MLNMHFMSIGAAETLGPTLHSARHHLHWFESNALDAPALIAQQKTVSQLINRVNMKEQPRQRASSLLVPLSLLCIALAGCTVGPDYARPDVAANADYAKETLTTTAQADIATGGAAQRLIAGMDIPGQWWTLFRSPA